MASMTLLTSPLSPFGRKVAMTARIKGVLADIDVRFADSNKGDPELAKVNPLAKIPALMVPGGGAIFDSPVICEYLDHLAAEPVLFPRSGPERWRVLTLGALADGILEAALLMVYERRFRPEDKVVASWLERQQGKVDGALAVLEAAPPPFAGVPDYGTITVAAALGYLDFRHQGKWRAAAPRLVAWLDHFAKAVPSFEATRPVA